jgi:hypothetical protein
MAKSGVDIVSLLQALSVPEYYLGTDVYSFRLNPAVQ